MKTGMNKKLSIRSSFLIAIASLCLLLICFHSYADGIGVGQKCPDVKINNIINYHTSSSSIAAYQGKLIILDFMATGCISCIEALPKLDSLQKEFAGQLQVFIVTYEKMERVKHFLEKTMIGKKINLPFVTDDSLLKSYFPHEFISHVVWLDKESIVKAITGTQYLKEKNIEAILSGAVIDWPVKREPVEYDYNQTLVALNQNNIPLSSLPTFAFYSGLTGNMPGVIQKVSYDRRRKSEFILDSINQRERFYIINFPILNLYLKTFGQSFEFPTSRMILEVKNLDRFVYDPNKDYLDVWKQNNTYCYEALFPLNLSIEKKREKIRTDLNILLRLNARMEKRRLLCLILVRTDSSNRLLKASNTFQSKYEKQFTITISGFIYKLNHTRYRYPVLDETGIMSDMYMQLNEDDFSDIFKLKKAIKKYGLDLKEEEREVEMFVLTEDDFNDKSRKGF
jgi:thiol-disulfide isomerase/thioredoxin